MCIRDRDEDGEIIGYEFVRMGPMMEMIKKGVDANEAVAKCTGNYLSLIHISGRPSRPPSLKATSSARRTPPWWRP